MDELDINIGHYLSCGSKMKVAENYIREYFEKKGLPNECIDKFIEYLKILRANINDLDKQIHVAAIRFRGFKCTNNSKNEDCCFLMLGAFDVL